MYQETPLVEKPTDENSAIWRFMDFTKFVSLLDTKSLFFTQAAHLLDRFEGSLSSPTVEALAKELSDSIGRSEPEALNILRSFKESGQWHFINSWHINSYESAAMWRLFARSEAGVAVKTTFRRLTESFHVTERSVFIGKVRYIDYQADHIEFPENYVNTIPLYYHKRRSFEYERELRAVTLDSSEVGEADERGGTGDGRNSQDSPKNGIYVPVDLVLS